MVRVLDADGRGGVTEEASAAGASGPSGDAAIPWTRVAALALSAVAVGLALHWRTPSPAMLALGAVHGLVMVLRPRWIPALLILDLPLVAWESAHEALKSFRPGYDSWVHMALIRRVVDFGPLPPHAFYVEHIAAPLYSVAHVAYASVATLFGVSVPTVWRWAHPVVVGAMTVAAYFAHRELLRRDAAALVAALVFVVLFRFAWGYAGYPRVIGPTLNLVALGLAFRALRSGRLAPALGAGAALGLAFACHPVSGLMGATILGLILLVEVFRGLRGSGASSVLRVAGAIVAVSLATAAPWLVGDAIAWMNRIPGDPVSREGSFAVFLQARLLLRLAHVSWPLLPIGVLAAGVLCAVSRPRDPLLLTYLGVASLLGAVLPMSFLGNRIAATLGWHYALRLIEVFPLPALAGLALTAWDHPGLAGRRLPRAVGLATLALCVSLLFWNLAPWQTPLRVRAPIPRDLAALEPVVQGRVVVAPRIEAYRLPGLTGAFVAWNGFNNHGNRWIYDPRRRLGANQIIAGHVAPQHWDFGIASWTEFMERYRVELVVLRDTQIDARTSLQATGRFAVIEETDAYVVLEYRAARAGAAAGPNTRPASRPNSPNSRAGPRPG